MGQTDICDKCGNPFHSNWTVCPICGNVLNKSFQQSDYLNLESRFARSISAKIGTSVLLISIIGLILVYMLPWITQEYHPAPDDDYNEPWKASYDHSLEKSSGDKDAPEELSNNYGEDGRDFLKVRIGFSIRGFIIGIILGSILLIIGLIISDFYPKISSIINSIIGGSLLVPSTMIMYSGSTFLGLTISSSYDKSTSIKRDMSYTLWTCSWACYCVIIIGVILLFLGMILMKNAIHSLKLKQNNNVSTNYVNLKKRKVVKGMFLMKLLILSSIFGIICTPVLPLLAIELDNNDEEITHYLVEPEIKMLSESSYSPKEVDDIASDISMIMLWFWLTLTFSIFTYVGLTLFKTGKSEIVSHIILLIGIVFVIFGILLVVFHGRLIMNIGDYEDWYRDEIDDDIAISYVYNYIPLIMGIIVLLSSITYIVIIVPFSCWRINQIMRQYQQTQFSTPVEEVITEKKSDFVPSKLKYIAKKLISCPNCGTKEQIDKKYCGQCGNELKKTWICKFCEHQVSNKYQNCPNCGKRG